THNLEELSFLEAVRILPHNPHAETLMKIKQYGLLATIRRGHGSKINQHWPSIKICIRNKYNVKDAGMWFDYLDLLRYFNKDLHNAHYVCPRDLKKAHDRLMNKKRAIQNREALEKKKARAIENEAAFKALKEKFIGLSFSDGLILIKVLESVQEYVVEGDKLHHCVFTNNYFSNPDSLVLSARIENETIETIEISLKDFKILQCRGKHNQSSEHHDRIIELMNKNIRKIKQLTKQKQSA
ncbi:MAG: PcfJ domain-containing protein, partial [Paludibacter sp.]